MSYYFILRDSLKEGMPNVFVVKSGLTLVNIFEYGITLANTLNYDEIL